MKNMIFEYLSKLSIYNDRMYNMACELDRYPQLSKIIFDLCDDEEIKNAEYKTISYMDTETSYKDKRNFVFSVLYRPKFVWPISKDYKCEEMSIFINKDALYQRLKNIDKWIEKEDK
jgi:hypothetical protein